MLRVGYRQALLDYYFINLTSQKDKFYINDWFKETIIIFNKEKVRLSTNLKTDMFLYKTIALNIMSLWKSKKLFI